MKDDFYVPAPGDLAAQSADNRQGRSDEPLDAGQAARVIGLLEQGQKAAYADYVGLVEGGLAREIARVNLPLSLYTEWYWQIDLHNLLRFIMLRIDPHAQKEIRLYAEVMLEITRAVAPRVVESFERNTLSGVRFTGMEIAELKRRLRASEGTSAPLLKGKELERFEEKLRTGKQL
jgi:thymidylate synthase (FAD)